MGRENYGRKDKIYKMFLVFFSISTGLITGSALYRSIFTSRLIEKNGTELLLLILASVIGTLVSVVLVLSGFLWNITSRQRAYSRNIEMLTHYTDNLQKAATEMQVYEVAYHYFVNLLSSVQVTVFNRGTEPESDGRWHCLTNGKLPLCLIENKVCPLLKVGRDSYVDNIKKDLQCNYQEKTYKKGCYYCVPILWGEGQGSVLQLYSKKEYYFDHVLISQIKSCVGNARMTLESLKERQNLDHKASTDKLTGLYNSGCMIRHASLSSFTNISPLSLLKKCISKLETFCQVLFPVHINYRHYFCSSNYNKSTS